MKFIQRYRETDLDRLLAGANPPDDGSYEVARLLDSMQAAFLKDPDSELEATHLTGLMRIVHLSEKGDLTARSASKATGSAPQASGLPTRRRRIVLSTLFGTLGAKILAGGVAVAMASTGGLAAAGHLPDQMQSGISQAVEKIGVNIPDPEEATEADAEIDASIDGPAGADVEIDLEVTDDEAGTEGDGEGDDGEGDDGEGETSGGHEPNEHAAFGQSVAEDARDGGVDGRQIAEMAHQRNEERKASRSGDGTDDGGSGDAGDDEGEPEPEIAEDGSAASNSHRPVWAGRGNR